MSGLRTALSALVAVVAAFLSLVPDTALAQNTRLTVNGFPLIVVTTDGATFEAGAVLLGTTSFTVENTRNNPAFSPRATTVQIGCSGTCPQSGTSPLGALQWRRDDQASWTTLTSGWTDIESRTLVVNGSNDPWSRTLQWRYVLDWTTNPPTPVTEFRIHFRLVVSP